MRSPSPKSSGTRDSPADENREEYQTMSKKQVATESTEESLLITAAKAVGTTAGKIVRLAEAALPGGSEPAKSQKIPKLAKKGKHGPPRKEKKALRKNTK